MTPEEALDKAVSYVGTVQNMADHLGVTKGAISQWKQEKRRIPAEHCPAIERLTNRTVRCETLRPDVDWEYLRLVVAAKPSRRPVHHPDTSPRRPVDPSQSTLTQDLP
ncbi:helix-turn-helix domain-containing protein [Massilia sp. CCM 8734]|uniref:transcriptional regulator n=1 Tax=Massilia sp. CCM 8734 TaxID=2609283 RepID=UPI00141F6BCE|nr:helix-turn-helix domain-containing protein [Massilia sp. CCM 8734]NHZ94607.1 transcriptional regulator [Massilia sp. CCM 8734]